MKLQKLIETYDTINSGNLAPSTREFRYNLGKAINSLTVIQQGSPDNKEIEQTLQELHRVFEFALELEHAHEKEDSESSYP